MYKKKSTKKKAAKKAAAPKKAYKKRNMKYWDSLKKTAKKNKYSTEEITDKFEEDGMELLSTEPYDGKTILRGFRTTKEYIKMEQIIEKMLVKESFVIKDEWKNFPKFIIKEKELPIIIRIIAVAGNDKYKRVVRMA